MLKCTISDLEGNQQTLCIIAHVGEKNVFQRNSDLLVAIQLIRDGSLRGHNSNDSAGRYIHEPMKRQKGRERGGCVQDQENMSQ